MKGRLLTTDSLEVPSNLRHLYAHFIENGLIVPIRDVDDKDLQILPKEVLRMIQTGDPAWERLVPPTGVRLIKERGVFGYGSKA